MNYIMLFFVVILQNASFTLVSRARNTKSLLFHAVASIFSNGIWFVVVRQVTKEDPNTLLLGITYVVGTVTGSVLMHHYSMKVIEKWFEKYTDDKVAAWFKGLFKKSKSTYTTTTTSTTYDTYQKWK
jgi:hypothetical protein